MLPKTLYELERIRKQCKKMVMKRACISGAASVIPVPGTDVAIDVVVLTELIQSVNKRFGLSKNQIDAYDAKTKIIIFNLIKKTGRTLIGKVITREVIIWIIQKTGNRIILKQILKYIPLLGQTASFAISVSTMKYIGNSHVSDCYRLVRGIILQKEGKRSISLLWHIFRLTWL
jgi:uncharacterized protein (DUF697 family)